MRLLALGERIPEIELTGDAEITGATHDSRRVAPGQLFVAVEGARHDGHQHIAEAVAGGAAAAMVRRERLQECAVHGIPLAGVPDTRASLGSASAWAYGDPSLRLHLTGVTGTNGKTTTVRMVDAIARAEGRATGTIGTLGATIGDDFLPHDRTTPEAPDLQCLLHDMVARGVASCSMEVASHALSLGRVSGCAFDVVAFTNLTPDHLDFHGTMEAYRDAKALLFTRWCEDAQAAGKQPVAVVNIGDEAGKHIARRHRAVRLISFGANGADLAAEDIVAGIDNLAFTLRTPWGSASVRLPFGGTFQVQNALAAAGCALARDWSVERVAEGLAGCRPVPGRFEPVVEGQEFCVVVDYAHTPDGLENVLRAARPLTRGRLLVVFGCGGDRDRTKRPLMGAIAARMADTVWVTSDNPRTEEPGAIVAGRPISLLKFPGVACTTKEDDSTADVSSLVVVLPTDPVIPTTGPENSDRIQRAIPP